MARTMWLGNSAVAGTYDYFAATDGSATGDGSIGDPWTLAVALAGGYPANTLVAGDIVGVRGGTYTGTFESTLAGSNGNPIIIKAYNRERVTIDGDGTGGTEGGILLIGGSYTRYQELEVIDSDWLADFAPDGIAAKSSGSHSGIEIINCIVHDVGGNGIGAFSPWTGLNCYGNLLYYNGGTEATAGGQAYNLYTQNLGTSPYKVFENNCFHFQWGVYSIHVYTEGGEIQNFRFKKNSMMSAGDLKGSGRNWEYFGSASTTLTNFELDENCIFGDAFSDIYDQGLWDFGVNGTAPPHSTIDSCSVTNNYMGAGCMAISDDRTDFTMTGNTMWGEAYSGWTYGAGGTFPTNTFHASRPGANWVKVYPNTYETGRAMLVCFNWASAGSQNFDFSSFLNVNDTYEVKDAFNFYGSNITSGTYGGGNVSITLAASPTIATALKVPTGYSQPQHPAPDYYVFIVRKT